MTTQSTLHNDTLTRIPGETRLVDGVLWKLCGKCGEWWIASTEFFPRLPNGSFHSPCRACTDERRREMAATKPCAVKGCTNPRYHWRYARCWEHRQYLKVNPQPRVYRRKATA